VESVGEQVEKKVSSVLLRSYHVIRPLAKRFRHQYNQLFLL